VNPSLAVTVSAIERITATVRRFTLVAADGSALPRFSGGSHIVVTLRGPERDWRNAYSLASSPAQRDHYQIAVRRLDASRGGSAFFHDAVGLGDRLEITRPANLFSLAATARKHLLIAGGIGITPILAQLADLAAMGARFELHFAIRSLAEGPFASELLRRKKGEVQLYRGNAGERLDVGALLSDQPLGTHVYVCGPAGLIAETLAAARTLGWPPRYVHSESFAAPAPGKAFTAILARSGRRIAVEESASLLEALEAAGVDPPSQCRGGACGRCETDLLEGEAEHRDVFLADAVKARQNKIMLCVSRAKTDHLVLDL
jgi:dimethylamine monooxygenase subunit B